MSRLYSAAVAFGALLLTVSITACVSARGEGGRYLHRESGYSLPDPNQLGDSAKRVWRKVQVAEADFAFRGPNEAYMAISSHCDESGTDPAALGAQLLVGLSDRTRVEQERFAFAGGDAFLQSVEATQDDIPVRARTITWVRGGCVVDWVLVTAGSFPDVEETFDSWWRGFDPGSMPAASHRRAEAAR